MDSGASARIAQLVVNAGVSKSATSSVAAHTRVRVVEIGPGTGELTRALLDAGCDVTAIDVDPDMIRILRSREDLHGAHIAEADALAFDFQTFAAGLPWRMTGNLPYNLATPLIMRLVEMRNGPEALVVMVQKEVAQRFAAQPGSKAYGSLSVATQYAMEVHREFTLGPGAFYPRPKVDSTVVSLVRRGAPAVRTADEHWFLQVVRAAFAYRRKTLVNSLSLSLGLTRASVTDVLQQLDLDTEIRGEQLSLERFAQIADRLRT
ncbi:MAG TPA: 16S rRNA (adenine(1518)-N(6)/adenine(1519)-N(6))-dimethyltransferase RsmA [Candidatus Baltobacteraceae bacterium]|jgi:16S rRNA (adenine1518-N6/adenine1519-N6)-dimethyltransferase|nr:16S rRNA (adenine(1518)-N(6)/adenine(1519)-N(6))-dimethyltransferase RsmA [Candidatus Baltobacteraceae bacterium]